MKNIRIGILGASHIAPLAMIEPAKIVDGVEVTGIASSNIDRAREYAAKYNIANVFDTYDELINSDLVDAVYISLSNEKHCQYTVSSIKANKHVLVEKPMCLNSNEFSLILHELKDSSVVVLEAMMVQHHDWQSKVKEIISSKIYGEIKKITSVNNFTSKDYNGYRFSPQNGGGALFDNGVYCIQFIQQCIKGQIVSYESESKISDQYKVDLDFNAKIKTSEDIEIEFTCSIQKPYKAYHIIEFENILLLIWNFFLPAVGNNVLTINLKNKQPNKTDIISFPESNYYVNQLEYFVSEIKNNSKTFLHKLEESGKRIELIDSLFLNCKKIINNPLPPVFKFKFKNLLKKFLKILRIAK